MFIKRRAKQFAFMKALDVASDEIHTVGSQHDWSIQSHAAQQHASQDFTDRNAITHDGLKRRLGIVQLSSDLMSQNHMPGTSLVFEIID